MSSTVTIRSVHPPLGTISEMDTIHEDSSIDDVGSTPRTMPARPTINTSFKYSSGRGSGTDSPPISPRKQGATVPVVLNRPKKLSNSNSGATDKSYKHSGNPMSPPDGRRPSWPSQSELHSMDLGWKPGQKQRKGAVKKSKLPAEPNELFSRLPGEVIELVLSRLKRLHLEKGAESCATCLMRDLCNIALCSRKCLRYARASLYGDIQIIGADSGSQRKKFKQGLGSRMILLRRTLRSNEGIAALVKCLKVPQWDKATSGTKGALSQEQYEDLTASLVMACPNLERLWGGVGGYDHTFKKIYHALSTRTQLREMDWLIEHPPIQGNLRNAKSPKSPLQGGFMLPGELKPEQEEAFSEVHQNWELLSSLSIHCLPGGALTPVTLLSETLTNLPALQHLHLCNLAPNAFSDTTLLSLPALTSLTLSHINGITSNGLSTFATRSQSLSLKKLQLRHVPLSSLPVMARLLSHLTSLETFSFVQAFPPVMPEDDSFSLWMMPYLASNTISQIHWDITSHRTCVNVADDILAKSITAGGFPQLRSLRTPNDPDGLFQALCRPVDRIDFPGDRFCNRILANVAGVSTPTAKSSPRLLHRSTSMNSMSSALSSGDPLGCTDLCSSRLAAQARLESARRSPDFEITVTSDDGKTTVETHEVGGFAGTLGSQIEYCLTPDPGSSDEKGGLVDVRDLTGDAGESLADGREGCCGAWNRDEDAFADKKERERWWHTERGRWCRVELG